MKIPSDQIATKGIAGHTKDGNPVVYIATLGGLHAFFTKNTDGQVESIGAAAHKAIAKFLASKKADIVWEKDFNETNEKIEKSNRDMFNKLRDAIFFNNTSEENNTGIFLVYDIMKQNIQVMNKTELENSISSGEVDIWSLIRDTSLSSRAITIRDSEFFNSKGGK
jgi:hypothetical protein